MADPERFQEIADDLGLDDFDRIATWHLLGQLQNDPYNDALNIQLGALIQPLERLI